MMNASRVLGSCCLKLSAAVVFLEFMLALSSNAIYAGVHSNEVRKININGFDTYLVNTHTGNGVALTVNVRSGSWHDDPVHLAGRAHLWEHWIHGGSVKYPGQKTFFDEMGKVGGSYNAYTAADRTFYHWYGHPLGLEQAADLLGSMLSNPEWNFETYNKELKTVKNEAKEYQDRDDQALRSLMFLELLPEGHPLRMYDVGTQEQLLKMDPLKLKALYYANYRPGPMQIIFAGNFDLKENKTDTFEQNVIELLSTHFVAGEIPEDIRSILDPKSIDKVFPTTRNPKESGNLRFIEVGTSAPHSSLQISFESTGKAPSQVAEVIRDYLNSKLEGSLFSRLKLKGWVTSLSCYAQSVNSLTLSTLALRLTEEGLANRNDVVELILQEIANLKSIEIQPKILELLARSNIVTYEDSMRHPRSAAGHLARSLETEQSPDLAFDFRGIYDSITEDLVLATSKIMFPDLDSAMFALISPSVTSEQKDRVFGRPIRRFQNLETYKRWQAILDGKHSISSTPTEILVPQIPIDFSDRTPSSVSGIPRVLVTEKFPGTTILIEENHKSGRVGVDVLVEFPTLSTLHRQALIVKVSAFKARFADKFEFLNGLGVNLTLSVNSGMISLAGSGPSNSILSGLPWMLTEFMNFTPDESEIAFATHSLKAGYSSQQDSFTAHIALGTLKSFIRGPSGRSQDELFADFPEFTPDAIDKLMSDALLRTFMTTAVYGSATEVESLVLTKQLRSMLPGYLPAEELGRLRAGYSPQKVSAAMWQSLGASKADNQFGWARFYSGPPAYSREDVAATVLMRQLGKSVFQLNRIEKDLGYVQGAYLDRELGASNLFFVGQTEERSRVELIAEGWDALIDKVKERTLVSGDFSDTIEALKRNELLLPYDESDGSSRLLEDWLLAADPQASEKWKSHLSSMTTQEVYEVGEKYLTNSPHFNVIASRKPDETIASASCSEFFQTPEEARKHFEK